MNAIDRAKLLEWTRANLCPLCERVIGIGLEYGAFDIKPHEGRTGQAIRVPGESNGRMKPMTDTEKRITVNKRTIIEKLLEGISQNGCMLTETGNYKGGTLEDIVDPLVKYLKRKGIEVR